MTLHLTRYYGINLKTARGSNNRNYLCAVVWYRRAPKRLGYLYFSIPISL
jgi:hypothetical protein